MAEPKNFQHYCIQKTATIKQTMQRLDFGAKKIVIVVEDNRVLGTVSDGDIRRWILKNGDLNESIEKIMNTNPIVFKHSERKLCRTIMQQKQIQAIPIVDAHNKLVDIVFWDDLFLDKSTYKSSIDLPVVIMAGGKGKRLLPYTKVIPKPLIPIDNMPIVERIIQSFQSSGCHEFYMSVNYKKNMIKAYFNDEEKTYNITYIDEEKPLGTGGSLALLKEKIKTTFIVSNCDILVDVDYSDILDFHQRNNNKITMITSLKNYVIPYGVIKTKEHGYIESIEEKPQMDILVNTGVYLLEADTLDDIPCDTYYNITELINTTIEQGEKVGSYPIAENMWLDMGQLSEMDNMVEKIKTKGMG